ncbi:MAG: endopeptidase La [Deltaproteobacteria bacterium]|jgi:ATP-dependent Lon protease|nr:endopeptidase La [Deltaproteobacteria bacterium]
MKNGNCKANGKKTTATPDLVNAPGKNVEIPDFINLLPMACLNSFPRLNSTISVDESVSRLVVEKSYNANKLMGLFALKSLDVDTENLTAENFYNVGVAVKITDVAPTENGFLKVFVKGLSRISLNEILCGEIPVAHVSLIEEESPPDDKELLPLILEAKRLYAEIVSLIPNAPVDAVKINNLLDDNPTALCDLLMAALPLKSQEKAEYLLIRSLKERYLKLLEHLTLERSTRAAGRAISKRVEDGMQRRQKEMLLREQLKAIKAELGENEEQNPAGDKVLIEKINGMALPAEARAAADREIERLKANPPMSAEHGVIRHYLEWIADLPWFAKSGEAPDLEKAREILDRDHFGMEKVKKRLLEFLAVRKLTAETARSPVLCLIGPPGVGKTSLGRSVAEAMGRKFVRLSLGGVRDEAEIRGHRRTYVGSRPGRIISSLKKAKTNNPVFLLDELDKMGRGSQGDPAAALLEALDPEQNDTFTDHFLEVPFDLSRILFIMTANVLEEIPAALRDRLEIIELSGYTVDEKVEIARRHLWPRELGRHGLKAEELEISPESLESLITGYTWEAGCRELTRLLSALIRSRAVSKAEGIPFAKEISPEEFGEILGLPRRRLDKMADSAQMGVVTGLAWTPGGGDIMYIEAVSMPGSGRLSLTGKLGEVMKESAQAAISYVRSQSEIWRLDQAWFKNRDIHLHLPQGAIPKDGPSAGVALATAIVSLASAQRVRPDLAMTGEISFRGLVLPVGGLKEKLLAAKMAGIKTVVIPERNHEDVAEMDPKILSGLQIVPVKTLDQVLSLALIPEADSSGLPGSGPAGESIPLLSGDGRWTGNANSLSLNPFLPF